MMAHTPGPWKISSAQWLQHSCHWSRPITSQASGSTALVAETNTANADLIVAAPELLECLKDAIAPFSGDQSPPRWVSVAQAVIAKAEGRT